MFFLGLPFNPSTVSQHTLQIATVVSMQLKLYCWQWRGAKNLITTILIGKVNLLLTLIYINILDAISWYQGIWNSFVRLSYHVIIRFVIHPRYRVIQETVFYNLPLTDRKNQINCITQWFLGSWYLDILIFWCLSIVRWQILVLHGCAKTGIDKSLDLEKFSKRNDSQFSLSSWRGEFSYLVLLSIFKILRKKFSFSSRFSRFYIEIHFLLSIFKIFKMKYWYWKSLSLLDCQYNFLLSPINILKV